jgi:hypothetical protein
LWRGRLDASARYTGRYSHADCYAGLHGYARPHGHADADGYAHRDADGNADGDSNAYAYADTDADARPGPADVRELVREQHDPEQQPAVAGLPG